MYPLLRGTWKPWKPDYLYRYHGFDPYPILFATSWSRPITLPFYKKRRRDAEEIIKDKCFVFTMIHHVSIRFPQVSSLKERGSQNLGPSSLFFLNAT
jgi:hypothetical protein